MDFLSKLLKFYNITLEEFNELSKEIKQEELLSLANFNNGEKTLECLKKHVENGSKIIIYGDYDCDGMMATSILKIAFKYLNYQNVGYYIPNRYIDGYGLTIENTKKFIEKGYKLIICVDNGISQFEAIDLARENGIDVIICDHHEIKKKLPNTPYIIHPALSDSKSYCSGGYTSFVLATGLLNRFDNYIFCLAAISIISDLMVLQNENRKIVKYALELLKKYRYKQIDLLAENNQVTEGIIGSLIAPKINSIGRMLENYNVNLIVKYFECDDINEIIRIYNYIEGINKERKALASNFDLENLDSEISEKPAIITVLDVKEGLIGLFANRLLDFYNKPSIVFSKTKEEGIFKGSIRSKNGISVLDLFAEVSEILLAYGGHECAGGFSIKEEDLEEFKTRIYKFCENKSFIEGFDEYIDINLNEITLENLNILEKLAPFGNGFKLPDFKVSNYPSRSFDYSFDGKHIITKLSINSSLICFNYKIEDLAKRYVDFYGTFRANYYRNRKNVNFVIKKMISKD